jgi:hypothetical protein
MSSNSSFSYCYYFWEERNFSSFFSLQGFRIVPEGLKLQCFRSFYYLPARMPY